MKTSFSLNDITKIQKNIFTLIPPISFGNLINEKKFTTTKMRRFFIQRYYNYQLSNKNIR